MRSATGGSTQKYTATQTAMKPSGNINGTRMIQGMLTSFARFTPRRLNCVTHASLRAASLMMSTCVGVP
jgi:hypothetical protein